MGRTDHLPSRASLGVRLVLFGVGLIFLTHWLVFWWVPSDSVQGAIQHIFYIHVPSAWITELAFLLTALFSVVYLWLGDERADAAASTAAEGGIFFAIILLVSGPLWASCVGNVLGEGTAAHADAHNVLHLGRLLSRSRRDQERRSG